LKKIFINSKKDNTVDISIIKNINSEISELEYKNIPIYKNIEMMFDTSDDFESLNLNLALAGGVINFKNQKIQKSDISIDENLNKIILDIKSSKMEAYLKERYVRRLEFYRKNKDGKYLATLRKRINNTIDSVGKLSYSPVLKARYFKLKEDYVYLNLLLLIL
jgi:hypothetical protein